MNLFLRLAVIVGALPVTLTNGTTADATQVMSDLNWIVNQVNANAAPLASAALVNANNNFTVVQSGIAATQPANFPIASQVQNSSFLTLSSTLGTNSLTGRIAALALGAYTSGQVFTFIPAQTNTGPATLSIDGLAATPILAQAAPLSGGELQRLSPVSVEFDVNGNFNLVNAGPTFSQVQNSALTTLTSALGSNQITTRSLLLPLTQYRAGQVFTFVPSQSNNPGSATLNVDGLGAKNIFAMGSASIGKELVINLPMAVQYDGVQFNLMTRQPGLVLLATASANNSATVDITNGITSAFDEYLVVVTNLITATDNVSFSLRVSEDGGATFKAGGTDYGHTRCVTIDGGAPGGAGGAVDAAIVLASALSNSKPFAVDVTFGAPSGTAGHKQFKWIAGYEPSASTIINVTGAGAFRLDNNAINAIRFLASSGNITSGTFALYGLRKT